VLSGGNSASTRPEARGRVPPNPTVVDAEGNPVTQSTLLCCNRRTIDDYAPDLERLPLEIARCSFDYFIASSKTERNAQLAPEIGTATELMSTEEMTAILNEVMAT
jgi:hypothetical protein